MAKRKPKPGPPQTFVGHRGQTHVSIAEETWPQLWKLAEWWSPHKPLGVSDVVNIAVRLQYEQESRSRDYWGKPVDPWMEAPEKPREIPKSAEKTLDVNAEDE